MDDLAYIDIAWYETTDKATTVQRVEVAVYADHEESFRGSAAAADAG